MATIPITIEYRIERLQNLIQKCYKLKKLSLIKNKLANLNFLTLIYQNKTLQELEIINQTFTKEGTAEAGNKPNLEELEES